MPIPYPPIEKLAVIGDRRTAAMAAADGTLCWLCLPDYNGTPVFGSLLDTEKGGFWRIGPEIAGFGNQAYQHDSAVLETNWVKGKGTLALTDFMAGPENERQDGEESYRTIIRKVHASKAMNCVVDFLPGMNFGQSPQQRQTAEGFSYSLGDGCSMFLWSSADLRSENGRVTLNRRLEAGETLWFVLEYGESQREWNVARAEDALQDTLGYWRDWHKRLTFTAPRRRRVFKAAKFVHLLSYAPTGSLVAAPTTSLPERIGGQSNYDYRFAWLRDASLSLASLSLLGDLVSSERYMDWLITLDSQIDAPLQPLYQIDGNSDVAQHSRSGLFGYRGSQPVLVGNHAYLQYQPDSYGYFAECALIYLQQKGRWKDSYWQLIRKLADFIADNWQRPSHGIWEFPNERHYVSSKVMAWVTLERSTQIAKKLKLDFDTSHWEVQMEQIHAEVMDRGWSEQQQSFVEYYGGEQLDASTLLISVLGFLPPDHPRVEAMLKAIERQLSISGLIYRFDPQQTLSAEQPPLGEFEGAFMPASFMMATAYAKAGDPDAAQRILEKVEAVAGATGLISEELDPRNQDFLGNTPLIFSLVEYIRAVMELAKAHPVSKIALMAGMMKQKLQTHLDLRR